MVFLFCQYLLKFHLICRLFNLLKFHLVFVTIVCCTTIVLIYHPLMFFLTAVRLRLIVHFFRKDNTGISVYCFHFCSISITSTIAIVFALLFDHYLPTGMILSLQDPVSGSVWMPVPSSVSAFSANTSIYNSTSSIA